MVTQSRRLARRVLIRVAPVLLILGVLSACEDLLDVDAPQATAIPGQ